MATPILGIETSCDETAASVVEEGSVIRSSVVATQEELHARFGGVVPEIACRAHVENVLPVIQTALAEAGCELEDLAAVAATNTPGLIGSLLVGLSAGKALSWALEVPLLAVNHLQAHIYAAWLTESTPQMPAVSLVVSGGHTSLYRTEGPLNHDLLGATIDDAAGEAFDKVANILHLGYPGGPAVDKAARAGDPEAVDFPRSWLDESSLDFSFSGLKTAVLYHCVGTNASREDIEAADYSDQFVADVAASFQEAVVDVLVGKALMAVDKSRARSLLVGGGVGANSRLRERLVRETAKRGINLVLAPLRLCTDNAAVTAGLGYHMLQAGMTAALNVEACP